MDELRRLEEMRRLAEHRKIEEQRKIEERRKTEDTSRKDDIKLRVEESLKTQLPTGSTSNLEIIRKTLTDALGVLDLEFKAEKSRLQLKIDNDFSQKENTELKLREQSYLKKNCRITIHGNRI